MTQHATCSGGIIARFNRRIIVKPEAKIRLVQFLIIQVRINSEVTQNALHNREYERLVLTANISKEWLITRPGPKV